MTAHFICSDALTALRDMPDDFADCFCFSPPYWGMRDYGFPGQLGLEPTLGEHLTVLVGICREVRRILKPRGTCWLNYGDCYATAPNGRSAADTKAAGRDDRTFRDKPFSTIGPVHPPAPGNPFPPGVKRRGGGNAPASYGRSRGYDGGMSFGGDRDHYHEHHAHAGPVYDPNWSPARGSFIAADRQSRHDHGGRIVAGGYLKPKDLCLIPARLSIALQDDGWWVRSRIVWNKPNPMPESAKDRPTQAYEDLLFLTKSERYFYDNDAIAEALQTDPKERYPQRARIIGRGKQAGSIARAAGGRVPDRSSSGGFPPAKGRSVPPRHTEHLESSDRSGLDQVGRLDRGTALTRNARNVWTIAPAIFKGAHFATFPPALVERCLLGGCPPGGLVIDPFVGSGTVALVAERLGMNSIGIDMSREYIAMAERRLAAEARQRAQAAE